MKLANEEPLTQHSVSDATRLLATSERKLSPYYIKAPGLYTFINARKTELPINTQVVLMDLGEGTLWIQGTSPEGHKFQEQILRSALNTFLAPNLRTGQSIPGPTRRDQLTSRNIRFRTTDTESIQAFLIAGSIGHQIAEAVKTGTKPETIFTKLTNQFKSLVDHLLLPPP